MRYLLLFILLASVAHGHLDAGSDDVVSGYLIDFGYSPAKPTAGEPVFINFNLLNDSTQEETNITSIWIRISEDDNIIFTGTLNADVGNAGFQFTFPGKGDYEILARFYHDSDILVENKFYVPVSGIFDWKLAAVFLLALILIIKSKKKHYH